MLWATLIYNLLWCFVFTSLKLLHKQTLRCIKCILLFLQKQLTWMQMQSTFFFQPGMTQIGRELSRVSVFSQKDCSSVSGWILNQEVISSRKRGVFLVFGLLDAFKWCIVCTQDKKLLSSFSPFLRLILQICQILNVAIKSITMKKSQCLNAAGEPE